MRSGLVAFAAVVLALTAACGGRTWQVRMEVDGPAPAKVVSSFAGETAHPELVERQLPWHVENSVGTGFSNIGVRGGAPGTVCRVFVDGKLVSERAVDATGAADCAAGTQE
ncbi:membrane protein [Amycolatopsis xylanica]|uniref:Membrane protein n=1 Tax=Amycolatopsis xylanica TaxID=589385 RepID=A0A1H3SNQ2_9PSEU|nr:MmpS family transport accessory protein [Amycolatopsis xylanica]SDZ39161.1 membrane protein [Amycolatopsis xylanica]